MKLRAAKIDDVPRLREFEQAVVEYERAFNPCIKPGKVTYYDLEHLLSDKKSLLLVAQLESEIIGSGYAQIRESKNSLIHPEISYLGFMYILPEHRGLGIVQKIIDRLIEWSLNKGVRDFYLDVYAQNESAIAAYRKLGFGPRLLEMSLHLDPKEL